MRVAIDARVENGRAGGVQQGLIAIATALRAVDASLRPDRTFVTMAGLDGWLRDAAGSDAAFLEVPVDGARRVARRLRGHQIGRRAIAAAVEVRNRRARPRASSGRFESTGADVVLFATQRAELCRTPFVYVPHDLQHRHLPELFRPAERRRREIEYRAYCEAAAVVVVFTDWAARDIAEAYAVDPARIAVIPPWAPTARHDLSADAPRLSDGGFALYPGQAWPHKNHRTLFSALAMLRSDGIDIPLVCPGATGDAAQRLRRDAAALGVGDLVRFPGFVDSSTMDLLWSNARCLVFPSLFEGWGYPVVEAMERAVPVACSEGLMLDAVAGAAALRFDPRDADSIARSLRTLWFDEQARDLCVVRGRAHIEQFQWQTVGERYVRAFEQAIDANQVAV